MARGCGNVLLSISATITRLQRSLAASTSRFIKIWGASRVPCWLVPQSFIAEARVWQRRHGGNLVQLYPYVIAARVGLQQHLSHMDAYVAKARSVAEALTAAQFPQMSIIPNPPHTNMMHVHLHGDRTAIENAALEVSRETGIFAVPRLQPTVVPDRFAFEWTVGDATLDITDDEIVGLFRAMLTAAAE